MAYWDGGSGTGGGGRIPPTSDVRQIQSPNSEQMTPDTEENVIDEAEDVIRNFIYESYRHQLEEEVDVRDSVTPSVPELCNFTSDPMRYYILTTLKAKYLFFIEFFLFICRSWRHVPHFFFISVDFTRVTLRSFVMFPYPLLFSVHYTCTLNIDILTFFHRKVLINSCQIW